MLKSIPKRGDIVWLDFDPTRGHEQAGHCQALVLSQTLYNQSGLMVVCPITTKAKGYNTEVLLPEGLETQGVILSNQIHTKDWEVRGIRIIENIGEENLQEVLFRVRLILGL